LPIRGLQLFANTSLLNHFPLHQREYLNSYLHSPLYFGGTNYALMQGAPHNRVSLSLVGNRSMLHWWVVLKTPTVLPDWLIAALGTADSRHTPHQ
jgi:hypothetical protein